MAAQGMSPKKARVLALINNKGGVTKTTSGVNLGYGFARKGYRVLLIDMDAQSNSTYSVLQRIAQGPKGTIYDVIMEKRPLHEVIKPTDQDNFFIVPSSIFMSAAEAELINEDMRERRLRNALRPYLTKFDYIIIDTPPNLGMLTVNSLLACTDVIIPITLNVFALVGISIVLNAIRKLRISAAENEIDAPMAILGVIVTQVRDTKESEAHHQNVKDLFGDLVIEPGIPLNVSVEMANGRLGSLYDLYSDSKGALMYTEVVDALDQRLQDTSKDLTSYYQRTDELLAKIPDLSALEQEEF